MAIAKRFAVRSNMVEKMRLRAAYVFLTRAYGTYGTEAKKRKVRQVAAEVAGRRRPCANSATNCPATFDRIEVLIYFVCASPKSRSPSSANNRHSYGIPSYFLIYSNPLPVRDASRVHVDV